MVAPVENVIVEVAKNARTLMAEGRRDFICKDYSSAAESFSQAVEAMTLEFGDRAPETAEGYFWYGKSLLEVSRNQQDFLGTKAENEDVENVDPQGEQSAENSTATTSSTKDLETVTEDMETAAVETPEKIKAMEDGGCDPEAGGEQEDPDNAENGETKNGDLEHEDEDKEGDNEEGDDDEDGDDNDDEVSDQQLAYEMFELARGIFESLDEPSAETETKRAECHMSIGEIAGENGQLEESIVEFDAALEIFEKCLSTEKRRRIAEVYFSLGCAQDAIYHYGKSIISFERSLETMTERLDFLNTKPEETLKPADKRELKSLSESIIPELKERIEDAKISEKKHEADKELIKQVLLQKSTTSAFDAAPMSSSSKPSASINHLVKRKRKQPATVDGGSPATAVGILEPSAKK